MGKTCMELIRNRIQPLILSYDQVISVKIFACDHHSACRHDFLQYYYPNTDMPTRRGVGDLAFGLLLLTYHPCLASS